MLTGQLHWKALLKHDSILYILGWDDGKIRAWGPETGKLKWTIEFAHKRGVTALACFSDNVHIVSGGAGGNVRVWKIKESITGNGEKVSTQNMEYSLKEHTAAVTCLKLNFVDTKCISSSSDGTCIIWDLV